MNRPEDIRNYVCREREVKFYRPQYDPQSGQFLGLYESIGFSVGTGDEEGHFLNYGFCKDSKILCSHHKRRNTSFFSDTFFNRHELLFESGNLQSTISNAHYFYSRLQIGVRV